MLVHNDPTTTLPLPVVVLLVLVVIVMDLRVAMYFIDDLYQPGRRVYGGNKDIWAVIILFGSVLGILAYVLFGREN